jgi:hypothetical protein
MEKQKIPNDQNLYAEDQQTIIYTILIEAERGEKKTIKALTDTMGFSENWFPNYHYRNIFRAARGEFVDSEAHDLHEYALPGILSRIEVSYRTNGFAEQAEDYMEAWRKRIDEYKGKPLGNPISAATTLRNLSIRNGAYEVIDKAKERIRVAQDPGAEASMLAHELQGVARYGGEQVFSYKEELLRASQLQPVSSGYPWIDDHLLWNRFTNSGGFTPTLLTSVLLPSEHGKTSLATAFAVKWIERMYPCVLLSAEEARHNMAIRVANAYTGIPPDKIVDYVKDLAHNSSMPPRPDIEEALDLIQSSFFAYETSGDRAEIERIVRRHRVQFGSDMPLLVMLDHIGAIDQGDGNWSRELEQAMKFMKTKIADEFRASVIVFSQVPADMEAEMREKCYTTKKEARGSRAIRQWSDIMIAGCRHNGIPTPSLPPSAFVTASVLQSLKNRFKDDRRGRINWAVYEFDVNRGIIGRLVTDDWKEQFSIAGSPNDSIG